MNIMDIIVAKKLSGGGGGTGTSNYNDLSNKPSINGTTLSGNKTAANLGLQVEITGDVTINSDNVDDTGATNLFVTSADKTTWSGKQDALTFDDTPTASSNNPVKSGGVYTALSGKQAAITNDNKLNPALIDYDSTYAAVSAAEKTTYSSKQDALTFDGTYSASNNKAATVSTVTNAVNALDVTGASNIAASKTIKSWSETDGKVDVSTQDIAITGSQATLTGYAKTTGDVAATDNVTAAIGKLETKADNNQNNISKAEQLTINTGVVNLSKFRTGDTSVTKWITGSGNTDVSCDIKAGDYVLIANFDYDSGGNNIVQMLVKNTDNTDTILPGFATSSNTVFTFTLTKNIKSFGVYVNQLGVTVTDFAIIPKTAYDIGYTTYTPYTPTNYELYQMILALQ